MTETTAARVFRLGNYEAKQFTLDAAGFLAANPPEARVAVDCPDATKSGIFGEELSGVAHSFAVVGDEIHCLIDHGPWMGHLIRESDPGFGCAFDRESKRLVRIEMITDPVVRDARAIPMGEYGVADDLSSGSPSA
jgi:hypothetical protein